MADDTTGNIGAPVPAIPAAPVAAPAAETPPASDQKTYRTNAERKFFEQKGPSSLPNSSTEVPPQEAAPVPPVAPDEPAQAAEPVIAEDDFSVDLPGAIPDDGVLLKDAPTVHPDSPLAADAPQWQHDAFDRLQADTSISPEDKKTIAALGPAAWDKARRWQADTKLLGQFRNPEVPISAVFDILNKQSKERAAELETEVLNRLVVGGESMVKYSEQHPREYASLLAALINDHSSFVTDVLKKKGFKVVKNEPFDKAKILEKLQQHPMWDTFSQTDIAELVEQEINEMAELVGDGRVTPAEIESQLETPPDAPQITEAFAQATTAFQEVRDKHWVKAIGDGLQAAGIKPPTQAEITANPAAAHLKTLVYNAALYGLDGVIAGWDAHSAKWGANQPGFNETFAELSSYIQRGELDKFKENSVSMNPFYFEFGKKRAQTALVQNLYRAVAKMNTVQVADPAPPAGGTPPPTTGEAPAGVAGERKYRTNSERRYFESLGK